MSDAGKNKNATDCFNRGSDAVRSGNFDYAIEMFATAVKLLPDNLVYRQSLRGAERKMYKDNRKGAMMAGMKMKPAQMKLQVAKKRAKWPDVMDAAEDALRYNPWESSLLYELGNAASELGFVPVAIWSLETAMDADRQNATALRLLAKLYEQTSQYDRAIAAWETVKKIDPADQDAAAKARQLAASATIQKGKYDTGESFQETMRNTAKGNDGEGRKALETPEERLKSEIATLEAKVAEDPANVNVYVQIGDKYRHLNDTNKAIAAYQKGLDVTGGGDLDIKVKMHEAQIEPFRRNVEIIEDQFKKLDKSKPDDMEKAKKLKAKFNANKSEIMKREIDLYRFKVQVNPADYSAFFELGFRLIAVNQIDEAIKALQQGRNDAQRKWEALYQLGRAFFLKKNAILAEKNLAEAFNEVTAEDPKKKILYLRGRVAEEKGDVPLALDFYNEVAAIDYGYQDVAKRIEELTARAS